MVKDHTKQHAHTMLLKSDGYNVTKDEFFVKFELEGKIVLTKNLA